MVKTLKWVAEGMGESGKIEKQHNSDQMVEGVQRAVIELVTPRVFSHHPRPSRSRLSICASARSSRYPVYRPQALHHGRRPCMEIGSVAQYVSSLSSLSPWPPCLTSDFSLPSPASHFCFLALILKSNGSCHGDDVRRIRSSRSSIALPGSPRETACKLGNRLLLLDLQRSCASGHLLPSRPALQLEEVQGCAVDDRYGRVSLLGHDFRTGVVERWRGEEGFGPDDAVGRDVDDWRVSLMSRRVETG